MKFTQDMMLQSDSGYCMPFEEKGKDVEMSLGYGKQKHPKTGEMFFHHGVDFPVKHYLLSALATGKVTGLGNDAVHGIYQVIRYGLYEVTYSHLSNVFANYGTEVKAGQVVAVSADLLHMEVKYNAEPSGVPDDGIWQHESLGAERHSWSRPAVRDHRHGRAYQVRQRPEGD